MYISRTLRASVTRSPLHFLQRSLGLNTAPSPLQELQITVSEVTNPGPTDRRPCLKPAFYDQHQFKRDKAKTGGSTSTLA